MGNVWTNPQKRSKLGIINKHLPVTSGKSRGVTSHLGAGGSWVKSTWSRSVPRVVPCEGPSKRKSTLGFNKGMQTTTMMTRTTTTTKVKSKSTSTATATATTTTTTTTTTTWCRETHFFHPTTRVSTPSNEGIQDSTGARNFGSLV